MELVLAFGLGFYCGWASGVLVGIALGITAPRLIRRLRDGGMRP